MDQIIKIRVSAEDKALFQAKADEASLSLSAWARTVLKRNAVTLAAIKKGAPT